MTTTQGAPAQSALIEALTHPACYPHSVESVTVLQTHASYVLLTGELAYKIKKPVKFAFLNYSTLERRHFFCQEEIRLNAKSCPGVYLNVVPITRKDDRVAVNGEGEVVEWAVRMRQLRHEDMLSTRLDAGEVSIQEIESVAHAIANFHQNACLEVVNSRLGTPYQVFRTIETCCNVMDQVAGGDAETRRSVRLFLNDFLAQRPNLFLERIRGNKIRDCHGDLRAQNICLDQRFGHVQLFDRIEFSRELHMIDTAADIAYLAMDLDLAGRPDLRDFLLETYERCLPDSDLRTLLPFYQTYRAVVRGNIALLAAGEPELAAQDYEQNLATAAAAYDLARCYARKRAHPALFITVGFSGSGKSTLAREVCRRIPAVCISSDCVRAEVAGDQAYPINRYSPENRASVYDELCRRAAGYLKKDVSVLLDATFLSLAEQDKALQVATRAEAEFWAIECHCDDRVIRRRLSEPHGNRNESEADIGIYENQRREFSGYAVPATHKSIGGTISVDTSRPAEKAAKEVIRAYVAPSEQDTPAEASPIYAGAR